MIFHEADTLSLAIFSIFAAAMLVLIARTATRYGVKTKFSVIYLLITAAASLLAIFGVFRDYPFPLLPIFFVVLILLAVAFAFAQPGQVLAESLSIQHLIVFQAFRFPLELLLHDWAVKGVIPETMTWTGQNFDIATGILALLVAFFGSKWRVAVWVFQVIGSVLLINVLRVVVMSSPLPISWVLENPLQLAFYFPYVLIGPVFVWPAILGHLLLFKKLLAEK